MERKARAKPGKFVSGNSDMDTRSICGAAVSVEHHWGATHLDAARRYLSAADEAHP